MPDAKVPIASSRRAIRARSVRGARGSCSCRSTTSSTSTWPCWGLRHETAGRVSRTDGRRADDLRPLELVPDFLEQPHGSVLFAQGKTKLLCTASIQEGVPRWLYGKGRGWLTAEYSLLPASTGDRTEREASRGRQGGRTVEIQRLIDRSIRSATAFAAPAERPLWGACQLLRADGGQRRARVRVAAVAPRR